MPILGVGVDVLSSKRLVELVARRGAERLAARILSPTEQPPWRTVSRLGHEPQLRFLALRWTAKEAAYKALYPRYVASWSHLTVVKDGPKPSIIYAPPSTVIARAADGTESVPEPSAVQLHLSYTHDGGQTLATVIAEVDGCALAPFSKPRVLSH